MPDEQPLPTSTYLRAAWSVGRLQTMRTDLVARADNGPLGPTPKGNGDLDTTRGAITSGQFAAFNQKNKDPQVVGHLVLGRGCGDNLRIFQDGTLPHWPRRTRPLRRTVRVGWYYEPAEGLRLPYLTTLRMTDGVSTDSR